MSSILKGIVDESENVAVIYIDGKAAAKYARKHEAERDAEFMRERFPNKKIEIKQEVRETELDENLHKWFKEKWVRFGPDGKIRGACARGSSKEGKPKCLPQSKAHALGKKGRKYAASKKRREDPNPERRGPAKNVATKKKTNESMNEDVGGNYLYHATGGLKSILQSGYVDPAGTPQDATYAQTNRPTVSLTRDWGYASGSNAPEMTGGIARHAILVFDRSRIENNFKTLATSQSWETRGTAFPDPGNLKAGQQARSYDVDGDGTLTSKDADEVFRRQMMTKPDGTPMSRQEVGQKMGRLKVAFYSPKAGHEFEEAVVVSKKGLPIKGTLVGFWVNPKSDLTKDPEVMNNPLRLEKTGPNKFVKASEKVMNEEKCPHCGGELVSEELMNEKQDACYRKVKSRYKVWPSAYASGALVQCRKKGAANWGNSSKKNESNIMKGIVDEASGTPGGLEMFRTKDMVDLAMQQNLYKRDLEKLKKAKQAEKPKPVYRKREPAVPGEEHSIQLASTAIPTALVKDWMENKSVSAVVDFIASRYAHRQSTEMIDEIKADPKFADAVSKFFDIAGKSLELRSKVKAAKTTVNDSRFRVEAEDLRLSGFEAFREITNVIVDYMKKYGVDKTGRRVPPGFNYHLEEGVIVGHDAKDPEVAILGGAGTMSLSRLKQKAKAEADMLANDLAKGAFKAAAYNIKQLANTLNTIKAAEDEMEKKYFGEDYTGEFAAEVTPAINPYGGLKDKRIRGAIGEALLSETPTDNPTGSSGEGGWRTYKPKSAGTVEEDTAYAGGMGQGGNAGQSYRKFKPKSAGTFKEDELDEACWKGYHKEGNKKMFGKTYPNCVKNTNEEEQLDEKCWDTHKQVDMKKKGDKMVPNCVPKESAIMKGLKR